MSQVKPPVVVAGVDVRVKEVSVAVVDKPIDKPIAKTQKKQVEFVGPCGDTPAYMSRRVDVVSLSREQQLALYSLWGGLASENAKLKNGQPIRAASHAIKWILENMTTTNIGNSDGLQG